MRRAGQASFDEICQRYPEAHSLILLAGKGNNGGDAYVVAGLAARAGWRVKLWHCVGTPVEAGVGGAADTAQAQQFARDHGVEPEDSDVLAMIPECAAATDRNAWVIIDGLFGTGLTRPPQAPIDAIIRAVNRSGLPIVALDVPSGLNASTGAAPGAVVHATLTVTFIGMKLGLLTGVGPEFAGACVLAPLNVSANVRRQVPGVAIFDQPVIRLTPRSLAAYKNQFGHLLMVGGDHGTGGAIMLAAEAALRVGTGLVSVATREGHIAPLLVRCPELMSVAVEGVADLRSLLARASGFVVGPGLGQDAWGEQLLQAVFDHVNKPLGSAADNPSLVLDADALNLVAGGMTAPPGCVMTPHPGEAARLLNCRVADIAADRVAAVLAIATTFEAYVVLKGVGSLIAAPPSTQVNGEAQLVGVCALGNPGMASAGMGDLLSGIVGGLIAQEGLSGQTVALAVAAHAAAGDRAADCQGKVGLIASDLLATLPQVLEG